MIPPPSATEGWKVKDSSFTDGFILGAIVTAVIGIVLFAISKG
jgi:hypothetical protein